MDLYSGTPALRMAIDDVSTFPTAADVVALFDTDVQVGRSDSQLRTCCCNDSVRGIWWMARVCGTKLCLTTH